MASIIDAFNDALADDSVVMKVLVYGAVIYYVATLFIQGKTAVFSFWIVPVGILLFALLTVGINNVRMNKKTVLTLNVFELLNALLKGSIVVLIQGGIWWVVGHCLSLVSLPPLFPHAQLIYSILIWSIVGSIFLTSYLSFAKYLKVLQGFNFKVIFESCVDVFISFLFFVPQLALADFILVGPVAYVFSVLGLSYVHWCFVAYCSVVFVINLSMIANYLAQSAYEHIKGNNEEYQENVNVNLIDDVAERMQ